MGILNATPDSFSGDGLNCDADAIVARGRQQVAEGAAILDLGGESTRPGARPVPEDVELARVLPALERLVGAVNVPISIDTSKPAVADAALRAGARIVNDVSGLRDGRLAEVAATHGAWLVVMDNGWTRPRPEGGGEIVDVVCAGLRRLVGAAVSAGVARERIVVDPGLGFGKSADESLALLAATAEIRQRLAPHLLLCGPSRKRFTGAVLGLEPHERLEPTLGAVAIVAYLGADIIRVHDVRAAVRAAWIGAAAASSRARTRLVYVGLGANLGDRRATLRRAVAALAQVGRLEGVSSLWETAPREVLDQPRFLNAVAAVAVPMRTAREIVSRLQRIEAELGRAPGPRHGPRAIDLDLLMFGEGREEREGDVVVPHARLAERRFALAPLDELEHDLIEPRSGRTVRELLAAVADQDAARVEGPEWWTGSS
jgi:dihydropteroate synthase